MPTEFEWSEEKDRQLIEQRGISFGRVVSAIGEAYLVDVFVHPNLERYPGQQVFVVEIDDYYYLVPFVTQPDGKGFLKTIIPSRKATRGYRGRRPQ